MRAFRGAPQRAATLSASSFREPPAPRREARRKSPRDDRAPERAHRGPKYEPERRCATSLGRSANRGGRAAAREAPRNRLFELPAHIHDSRSRCNSTLHDMARQTISRCTCACGGHRHGASRSSMPENGRGPGNTPRRCAYVRGAGRERAVGCSTVRGLLGDGRNPIQTFPSATLARYAPLSIHLARNGLSSPVLLAQLPNREERRPWKPNSHDPHLPARVRFEV